MMKSPLKGKTIKRWWDEIQQQQTLNSYGLYSPVMKGRPNMAQEKEVNKPEKKFRAGGITATIWKNTLKDGDKSFDVRSVNLERSYKDKEGNWQNTNSMRSSDLPRAILVLQKAYEFCASSDSD